MEGGKEEEGRQHFPGTEGKVALVLSTKDSPTGDGRTPGWWWRLCSYVDALMLRFNMALLSVRCYIIAVSKQNPEL